MTTPDPTGPDDHAGATRALLTVLSDRQWSPRTADRDDTGPDAALTITLQWATGTLAGTDLGAFTATRAAALERALHDQGIDAQVRVSLWTEPQITLSSPKAVEQLTTLVRREMPDAHQAALHLRSLLHAIGRHHRDRPFATVTPRARGEDVEITLTVPQAIRLQRLLGGRKTFHYSGWQRLDDLRRLLRHRLRPVMPRIEVTATPGCGDHGCTAKVHIGPAPLDHIRALGDRLKPLARLRQP
ncbi:hypothetical protein AB0D49_33175 [Streptomyces sp. NPDC048290]|uniref:hypothetical protein n=1 Tax=Streptomyces sp. NPDC048290 TaxID=3155811 RepID=UPI00342F6D42